MNAACAPSTATSDALNHYTIAEKKLMVSDKKIFHVFPYISLCKTCDPRGGAIYGPRGIICNTFGISPLGAATFQTSRL